VKRAVCLQHVPFEGPGCFAEALQKRGFVLDRRVVPSEGLPASPGDLLLAMGGPMSANDPDRWIQNELEFIHRTVRSGTPCLGICLGSQLLAKAMGGRVYAGPRPEIGMTTVLRATTAGSDPVFAPLPPSIKVFEWHGEGVEMPPDAIPLAASADYPVQAFRCGSKVYGLLFHLEVGPPEVESLCRNCPDDLARARRSADDVRAEAMPHLERLNGIADRLIGFLCGD
jgi:GMP synthase-like glutamine amidotransferase